jgi:eukaryotic-like serine/threonine-protein kinase
VADGRTSPSAPLEIAHVFFMDIVAYSMLPMDQQQGRLCDLQDAVRKTSEFIRAQRDDQLIRLPTGDGMALVFFGDPEAPVRCALELSQALREHPEIKLRMGIHTGPVYRIADINANRNVAGGGINMAQRVMDCGEAGHILLSKAVADVLTQLTSWRGSLKDLGEAEVKHGVRVHLFNLCTTEAGNPNLPSKLRKATVNKTIKWSFRVAAVLALTLLLGLAWHFVSGGLYHGSHQIKALTDKDTVVLADFDNKTSDTVFDDALKQALAVELGQSPFLNVLSDARISNALRMMGRRANERITVDVGRELCQRTGSKALLSGMISSLGSHYLIDLNAVACSTGDTLAKEQREATGKEDVLKALSGICSKIRAQLGESLPSVQRFDVPIEATTSSLEALKNYSMGVTISREKGAGPAIPFLKRAIELDPNFPLAYTGLALMYSNLSQPSLALEYATKAYQLRDRVSERERLRISAAYFFAAGEVEKEAQTYEVWAANYPRDIAAHAGLGANYAYMGQYDKALAEYQEALRLAPDDVVSYENLGGIYCNLNRLEDAKLILDQAFARKLDSGGLRQNTYYLAFLRRDAALMEQELAWGAGRPGDEDALLSMQSDTEAYYGRMSRARDFTRRAFDSALRADSKETAASWQVNAALREAEVGNTNAAKHGVKAALALSPGQGVKVVAALALARVGDASRAKALAEELEKNYPTNTLLKLYWLPTINAAIELCRGNASQALVNLEAAAPYELGNAEGFINYLYPAYVRGQAYLLAHNGPAAAAEFQKLVDHKGIVGNFVTGPLAYLQIGRANAMAHDIAKARATYQDFFTLWKEADADIPILKAAKAEYAKLE